MTSRGAATTPRKSKIRSSPNFRPAKSLDGGSESATEEIAIETVIETTTESETDEVTVTGIAERAWMITPNGWRLNPLVRRRSMVTPRKTFIVG